MMRVTFYSKPGCHLCEPVQAELQTLRAELGFDLDTCNILADAAAFERFRTLIPVVVIENGPEFQAPIDRQALREALRSASLTR